MTMKIPGWVDLFQAVMKWVFPATVFVTLKALRLLRTMSRLYRKQDFMISFTRSRNYATRLLCLKGIRTVKMSR